MSANNWTECPKCKRDKAANIKKLKSRHATEYGKIPLAEYQKIGEQITDLESESDGGETLREDYEIWINKDGVFTVDYGCSCDRCKFKFSFKHQAATL